MIKKKPKFHESTELAQKMDSACLKTPISPSNRPNQMIRILSDFWVAISSCLPLLQEGTSCNRPCSILITVIIISELTQLLSITINSTLWSTFTQYDYLFKKVSPLNTGNTYKLWEGTLPCQWAVDYQRHWQRSPRIAVLSVDKIAVSPAQSTLHQMWALTERSWRNVASSLESRHWCWRWRSSCVEICEQWL